MRKIAAVLVRIITMLIILLAFVVPLLPLPVYADTPSYFVMGQVFVVDGAHINSDLDGRWATAGNKTINLTDDGAHGTFSIYMANGTTGTVTSGTSAISGSPVTLSAGLNSITATGTGTCTLNLTLGTAANWNTVNSWAASSGGQCGAAIPTSSNSAYFDANSFTAASQVVTVDATANCLNMDWTGSLNTPTLTFGTQTMNLYGNLTLISGMAVTSTTGYILGYGVGKTIDTGNIVNVGIAISIWTGGTYTLINNNYTSTKDLGFGAAGSAFNTGNFTVSCGIFFTQMAGAKTITLGTSTITCTGCDFSAGTVTLSAANSTVNVSGTGGFNGGGYSWGTVNLNGTSHVVSGSNTFVNLTRNGTATKTDTLTLTSGTTQTVTGTCALIGNSAVNRLLVQSSTLGTAATINNDGNWTGTNACDFMDITSTHAVDMSNVVTYTNYIGDCGGNTGITCTASDAQTSASTASWATVAGWTGTVISRVPLPQDDVTCSHSKTVDMPRIGRSITFTGTPTITLSNDISNYGSWTMVSGMTYTHNNKQNNFRGRDVGMPVGGWLINPATKSIYTLNSYAVLGTYKLSGNASMTNNIQIFNGTFNADIYNVTTQSMYAPSSASISVLMGSGIWTTGINWAAMPVWTIGALCVVDAGTSTIVITNSSAFGNTFAGGGLTYNNVTVQGAGNYALTISGNNTFAGTFTVDRSVAAKTLTLTATSNQTIADFSCPTSSTRVLTINSTGAAATLTKSGGGGEMVDYVNLSNNTGSPANTWYYGLNSTIGAGVTGWNAGIIPSVTTTAATNVEETTATANGNITDLHYSEPATVAGIDYDTDSGSPYAFNAHTHGSFPVGAYSQALTGLTKGELYYYSANVTDMAGIGNGGELTFLTKPDEPSLFTATSGAVSGRISLAWIKGTGAQNTYIRGNIGSAPTFSGAGGTTVYNSNGTSFNHDGLTGGNVWYYRAYSYAIEGGLEQYSDLYDDDDETAVVTPTVTTQAVTLVEETTAVLNGTIVNTGGINSSTRGGEYDVNTGFPYAVSVTDAGSFTAGAFTKSIAGLSPGTLYYTVSKATTGALTGYGAEVTFLTKPLPVTNVVITPSAVNQLTVTWTKGTGALRTLVRYKENGYPTSKTDGTQAYFDTGTTTTIVGLMENKTYFVRLWSERTEGGWQQYDDDTQDSERASGIADNMMNTIVSLTMALMTVICMFVLIGQLGNESPIADTIKIVIIAALGMICFVVMKGVIGM